MLIAERRQELYFLLEVGVVPIFDSHPAIADVSGAAKTVAFAPVSNQLRFLTLTIECGKQFLVLTGGKEVEIGVN